MRTVYKTIGRTAICTLLMALCMPFFNSCSDNDVPTHEALSVTLSDQEVNIGFEGRYYNIDVNATKGLDSLSFVRVTTDADWVQLDADTLSRGGQLWFYVSPNEGERSREAIITLYVGNRKLPQNIIIHQRCEAEESSNALSGDSLSRKARVGYGYNMLIDYMDPKSVTVPILDYEKLVKAEQTWGTIISEEGRAQQSLEYHSSYSAEEMSSWMSTQTTTEVDFLFVNKSVSKYESTSEYDLSQQTFGYSSLRKVVATRYIDEGKVQSIIRQGQDLFTSEFRELYDQINANPTEANVKQLVTKFGTHLVTYADLGGRLDYSMNFRSEETSRESVEKYLKYKNGKQAASEESQEASHSIIISGSGLYCDIYGGSTSAINALKNDPKTKDPYGQVDPAILGQWLNSVKASDPNTVSLVRCILQPIWQLFDNEQARVAVINYIIALAYSESGEVGKRLQELGLDNYYRLDVTDAMLNFGTDDNSTQAKVVYYNGLPKIEICNEYVPELRGDRRVTIFYPIYKQQTNIRRGFFLGDGENAPAEVTFDNVGGCYVRQLEGYGPGDKLTTLYYVDGSFYDTSIGIKIPPYTMTVSDEWLRLFNHKGVDGKGNYPIVKIGPGFWTRAYLTDKVGFVDKWGDSAEDVYVANGKNVLYSDVFRNVNSDSYNIGNFTVNDQNHWYLPTSNDLNTLMKYVGENPKALFKNQMSGFNADFCGYVVRRDLQTEQIPDEVKLGYVNKLCVIAFHDDDSNGTALLLKPDYTWETAKLYSNYHNRYPIRAFRTKKFKHNNK